MPVKLEKAEPAARKRLPKASDLDEFLSGLVCGGLCAWAGFLFAEWWMGGG